MKPPTVLLSCALSVVACGGSDRHAQPPASQTTTTSSSYELAPATPSPAARAPMSDATASPPPARDTPVPAVAVSPRISAKLAAEVRRSIATDATLSVAARGVRVSVIGSTITLRGTVDSEAERAKVEKHARLTTGVTEVHNQVEVRR